LYSTVAFVTSYMPMSPSARRVKCRRINQPEEPPGPTGGTATPFNRSRYLRGDSAYFEELAT
jgi:hypothetical protein